MQHPVFNAMLSGLDFIMWVSGSSARIFFFLKNQGTSTVTNFLFCLVRNLITQKQQQQKQQNKLCSLFLFLKGTFLAPKSRRDINFRGKKMAGRSGSKTLMNLPLRKKALPVILHFSPFFFCEPVKLLHGQAYYYLDMIWGEPTMSGNPEKFHKPAVFRAIRQT